MKTTIQIERGDSVLSLYKLLNEMSDIHAKIVLKKQTQIDDVSRPCGASVFPTEGSPTEVRDYLAERAKAATGYDIGYIRAKFVIPTVLEVTMA